MININMLKRNTLLFLLFAVILTSCGKETEEVDTSTFGYDFLPIQVGKSYVYQSDSIIFDDNGARIDTFHGFIREDIEETFVDDAGITNYKLFRYFKRDASDQWTRTNTWTTYLDDNKAIRTEENIRFIKLVFPIKKGLKWDGNIFVDQDIKIDVVGEAIEMYKNWDYKMETIDEEYDFNGSIIPTIRVNLVDESSIIDRRKVTEYYAKGIGLVKKEMIILDSDGSQPAAPWEEKAQKGFIHTLTLISVN
jgi:hypothetical protein